MEPVPEIIKGRGSSSRQAGRYQRIVVEPELPPANPATRYDAEQCKSLISRNSSPDVPFSQSINPYRGCEHGCVYCFARPTHSYLDLSPGLDFETRIFCKDNAVEVLRRELSRPGYRPATIALGAATDPYQPVERERLLTRQILALLSEFNHPVSIISKSALLLRDLDILAPMAARGLASVALSVTTLDDDLKTRLEPRASSGRARLRAMRALTEAGVPVTLLLAPVIPFINDHELEAIVAEAALAGASAAGYVMLRLPHELAQLWQQWLQQHYPQRADRVMSAVRDLRGGADYQSAYFERQTGRGVWAALVAQRFALACRRHGLGKVDQRTALRTDLFQVPGQAVQLGLFAP